MLEYICQEASKKSRERITPSIIQNDMRVTQQKEKNGTFSIDISLFIVTVTCNVPRKLYHNDGFEEYHEKSVSYYYPR